TITARPAGGFVLYPIIPLLRGRITPQRSGLLRPRQIRFWIFVKSWDQVEPLGDTLNQTHFRLTHHSVLSNSFGQIATLVRLSRPLQLGSIPARGREG